MIGVGGSGPVAEINLLALMQKHARIHGSTLRARPLEEKALAARLVEREVLPHFESGALTVPVAATFPLDGGRAGLRALRGRRQARQDRAAPVTAEQRELEARQALGPARTLDLGGGRRSAPTSCPRSPARPAKEGP